MNFNSFSNNYTINKIEGETYYPMYESIHELVNDDNWYAIRKRLVIIRPLSLQYGISDALFIFCVNI